MPQRYMQPILKAIAGVVIAVMLCITYPRVANAQVLPNQCVNAFEVIVPGGSVASLACNVYDVRVSTYNQGCDWFIDVDNGYSRIYIDDLGGSETVTYIDFGFTPKSTLIDNSGCPGNITVDYCLPLTLDG